MATRRGIRTAALATDSVPAATGHLLNWRARIASACCSVDSTLLPPWRTDWSLHPSCVLVRTCIAAREWIRCEHKLNWLGPCRDICAALQATNAARVLAIRSLFEGEEKTGEERERDTNHNRSRTSPSGARNAPVRPRRSASSTLPRTPYPGYPDTQQCSKPNSPQMGGFVDYQRVSDDRRRIESIPGIPGIPGILGSWVA